MTVSWIRVASVTELENAGGVLGRTAGGIAIALFAVDGEYFATADRCTHGQGRLSEGYLEGHLIECPLHQGLFDIRTGEVKGPPCTRPVRTLPVRDEDGELLVRIVPSERDAATSSSGERSC